MKILSHRGYWNTIAEQNTSVAFERSLSLGLGIETDIRDSQQQLVIAHDMASGEETRLEKFLELVQAYQTSGDSIPVALNIKTDGLARSLSEILKAHPQLDCFVFDMSIPDMCSYLDRGIPVFTRVSEVEKYPIWIEYSAGIWLDSFEQDWFDLSLVRLFLREGKRVCVVSPELHRRPHQALWEHLKDLPPGEEWMLCTDYPEEAVTYFQST